MKALAKMAKAGRDAMALEAKLSSTPERHDRVRSELQHDLLRKRLKFAQALRAVPFSVSTWAEFTEAARRAEYFSIDPKSLWFDLPRNCAVGAD